MSIGAVIVAGWGLVGDWLGSAWCDVVRELRRHAEPFAGRLGLGGAGAAPPAPAAPARGLDQDVRDAKFLMPRRGPAAAASAPDDAPLARDGHAALPAAYGTDRVTLLARDPRCLFAYWEATAEGRRKAAAALGAEARAAQEVLRIHDVTFVATASGANGRHAVDVDVAGPVGSCYVAVPAAGGTYRAEIGLRTASGRFVAIAGSEAVATPPEQPAADTAVRWADLRTIDGGAGEPLRWSAGATGDGAGSPAGSNGATDQPSLPGR